MPAKTSTAARAFRSLRLSSTRRMIQAVWSPRTGLSRTLRAGERGHASLHGARHAQTPDRPAVAHTLQVVEAATFVRDLIVDEDGVGGVGVVAADALAVPRIREAVVVGVHELVQVAAIHDVGGDALECRPAH